MSLSDDRLRASQHLSYFQNYGELFAYHDRFGFILGMSADVAEFVEFHRGEPRGDKERKERFEGQFEREQIDEFVAIFRIHQCLVETDAAERTRAWTLSPVHAPWVVYHAPDADSLTFWRTPSGGSPEADPQPSWAAAFWARIDGNRRLSELFESLVADELLPAGNEARDEFLEHVFSWVHHDRQYLKLSLGPVSRFGEPHRWPPYLRSTMPYAPWNPADGAPEAVLERIGVPIEVPHAYYADEVAEASEQFRTVETTLSHLFRHPHAALRGRSFARALGEALERAALWGPTTRRIVEVGGGLGHVAAGLLAFAQERWPDADLTYSIVDLSPALADAQRTTLRQAGFGAWIDDGRISWQQMNAEALDLPDGSVDLLVCNEVIGDFTTIRLRKEDVDEPNADLGEHGRIVRELGLEFPDANDEFYVNSGALRFVQHVAAALAPGGAAYISEYGDAHRYPIASTQLDHLEFSIHFGPLIGCAQLEGLEAHLHMLQDVLELDRTVQTLASTRTYFRNLSALAASLGVALDKRAYTRDELQSAWGEVPLAQLGVLRFDDVDQRVMGLAPHEFRALLLKRPATEE